MANDPIRTVVADLLRSWGFEVEELRERDNLPTADLLASKDARYLIEVKSREDDRKRLKAEERSLRAGELVWGGEKTGYQDRMTDIVRNGIRQLRSHSSISRDYCLLWLHASGRFEEVQMDQFRATLYGMQGLISIRDFDGRKQCYFFHNSEFFRYRTILDGAVLSRSSEAQLCLNTLSERYAHLRESALARAFGPGICDPEKLAADDEALIADTDIDRRDADSVLKYLQEKHGYEHLQALDTGHLWSSVGIEAATDGI